MITRARRIMDKATAREWFLYDPESGLLTWRKVRSRRLKVAQEAGYLQKCQSGKTYREVSLKGYGRLKAHRIIWCWVTGHFPRGKEEIDHENGGGTDNRWVNLRLVNKAEQQKNLRLREDNTTGSVGVYFDKRDGKYQAQIQVNGRRYSLGYFPLLEDAIAAREAASKKFGFHKNHGSARPL